MEGKDLARKTGLMPPKQRLVEFIESVQRLEGNRFFPDCLAGTLFVDLEDPERDSVKLSITEIDRDALKSFLVTFRRFTLEKDTCYLPKVYEAAEAIMHGTKTERWITLSKARVEYARDIGYPQRAQIGTFTQPIQFFKLWINAHPAMFHRNENAKQRRDWDCIENDSNQVAIVETMALQYIRKITREVVHLKRLISENGST